MKIVFKVTVEIDNGLYNQLIDKGYAHWQIVYNIVQNVRNMFSAMLKHWHSTIYDITTEIMPEETDVKLEKEMLTPSSVNGNMIITRG